ncbi:MAG TPA: hypothetical protein VJC39_04350 [Candidatus Nanoarchaeia archaeon]|nr:hypothetical protein [Candidatus Nanoarchaeia archaeon]
MDTRGQLLQIEFKYFFVGLIIGLVLALVYIYLGNIGTVPQLSFICPAIAP